MPSSFTRLSKSFASIFFSFSIGFFYQNDGLRLTTILRFPLNGENGYRLPLQNFDDGPNHSPDFEQQRFERTLTCFH
jgi:hypothetical protein